MRAKTSKYTSDTFSNNFRLHCGGRRRLEETARIPSARVWHRMRRFCDAKKRETPALYHHVWFEPGGLAVAAGTGLARTLQRRFAPHDPGSRPSASARSAGKDALVRRYRRRKTGIKGRTGKPTGACRPSPKAARRNGRRWYSALTASNNTFPNRHRAEHAAAARPFGAGPY